MPMTPPAVKRPDPDHAAANESLVPAMLRVSREGVLIGIEDHLGNDLGLPVTTKKSASGVGIDPAIEVSVGSKKVSVQRGQSRLRAGAAIIPGETLSNLLPGPAYAPSTAGAGPNSAKWGVLTLPDGRRRWGIKLTTEPGSGNQANIEIPISRKFEPTDVIDLTFYAPLGLQPNIYLTSNSMATSLRFNTAGGVGTMYWIARRGLVHVTFPASVMTGTATLAEIMTKLRVSLWNTICRGKDVWLLDAKVNRKAKTIIPITTDDGFESNLWLADQLKARGMMLTAYLITSRQDAPPARYMSWAQVGELYAKGNVQLASHTHNHLYVNGGTTGYVAGSSTEGISLAQTVASGALLLNGTIGASAFDKPRHLTFVSTGANYGVSVDVIGKLDGSTVTETVWLGEANGYPWPTENTYDQVTSLTVNLNAKAAAGNVKVGTSCSYDEIYGDALASFVALESRGYGTPENRHYCAPQGQCNETLFRVLADLGVKTCRLTDQTTLTLTDELDWYRMPAMIVDEAAAPNLATHINFAVNAGASLILYPHDIYTSGAPAGAINQASLTPALDLIAGYIASGVAESPTISGLYDKTVAVAV